MKQFFVGLWRTVVNAQARFGIWHTLTTSLKRPLRWMLHRKQSSLHPSHSQPNSAPVEDLESDPRLDIGTQRGLSDVVDIGSVSSPNWKHHVWHATLPEPRYRNILDSLRITHETFTFIDIGCGKGKVLLLAASYPYKKIIGVEYLPRLQQIALKNIAAYQSPARKCHNIEAVCADASNWPIPPDPCVFFFANPFDDTIMDVVIRRIMESLRNHPREAYIVYCVALHADVLRKYGFSEKTEWFAGDGRDILFECPAPELFAAAP